MISATVFVTLMCWYIVDICYSICIDIFLISRTMQWGIEIHCSFVGVFSLHEGNLQELVWIALNRYSSQEVTQKSCEFNFYVVSSFFMCSCDCWFTVFVLSSWQTYQINLSSFYLLSWWILTKCAMSHDGVEGSRWHTRSWQVDLFLEYLSCYAPSCFQIRCV